MENTTDVPVPTDVPPPTDQTTVTLVMMLYHSLNSQAPQVTDERREWSCRKRLPSHRHEVTFDDEMSLVPLPCQHLTHVNNRGKTTLRIRGTGAIIRPGKFFIGELEVPAGGPMVVVTDGPGAEAVITLIGMP